MKVDSRQFNFPKRRRDELLFINLNIWKWWKYEKKYWIKSKYWLFCVVFSNKEMSKHVSLCVYFGNRCGSGDISFPCHVVPIPFLRVSFTYVWGKRIFLIYTRNSHYQFAGCYLKWKFCEFFSFFRLNVIYKYCGVVLKQWRIKWWMYKYFINVCFKTLTKIIYVNQVFNLILE